MTRCEVVAIASGFALCVAGASARVPQAFRAQSDLVVLQVAVADRHGKPVTGLPREAFSVLEDRAPQAIQFFLNEDRPVAVGLVLDNSISMSAKRQDVIAAADAFARSSNREDQLFVVNFNEDVWFGLPDGLPFTSDLDVLHNALLSIGARGRTALYDGISTALTHVNTSPLDQKVLILVSDGGDNQSRLDFKEVMEQALRSNVVIYTVGIFDEATRGSDRKVLERLAESSGGIAFFPANRHEVGNVLDEIARDIRHRYTIGYVSSNTRLDRAFRKIQVVATDPKSQRSLNVKVRSGYLSPAD
jgi:VWFA-related protein